MTALGAVSLALFCIFRDENSGMKALFLKTAASVFFVLTAVFAVSADSIGAAVLIIPGLLFGLLGDILLDLKFIDKPNSDAYTFGGMGAFFIGHIFYIAALFTVFELDAGGALIAAAITVVLTAAVVVSTLKIMKYDYGKFLIPSAGYSALLIYFVVLSAYALISNAPSPAARLLATGSVVFLISDVILSMTYFGGKKGRAYLVANHTAYYAAQFLIALAVLFI
jgi:uncharacterized membrane protein YhhN